MRRLGQDHFLAIVEQAARTDRDGAQRAVQAVLQTLGERIAAGEARDLAEQLPPELAPWIATTTSPERFDVDEFLRRVAEREGTDLDTAERHARAVFTALGQVVSADEMADMAAELPKDFAPLLPYGPEVEVLPADTFERRVAERAGLDDQQAWRAVEAVLETLAERLTKGEVDDLIARLPLRLHAPLRRGAARRDGHAKRMSLETFVEHVAQREGVPAAAAAQHVRAVLATLREAVGDDEFFDAKVQLGAGYEPVLKPR